MCVLVLTPNELISPAVKQGAAWKKGFPTIKDPLNNEWGFLKTRFRFSITLICIMWHIWVLRWWPFPVCFRDPLQTEPFRLDALLGILRSHTFRGSGGFWHGLVAFVCYFKDFHG